MGRAVNAESIAPASLELMQLRGHQMHQKVSNTRGWRAGREARENWVRVLEGVFAAMARERLLLRGFGMPS